MVYLSRVILECPKGPQKGHHLFTSFTALIYGHYLRPSFTAVIYSHPFWTSVTARGTPPLFAPRAPYTHRPCASPSR